MHACIACTAPLSGDGGMAVNIVRTAQRK
jgi:hypothetical protein